MGNSTGMPEFPAGAETEKKKPGRVGEFPAKCGAEDEKSCPETRIPGGGHDRKCEIGPRHQNSQCVAKTIWEIWAGGKISGSYIRYLPPPGIQAPRIDPFRTGGVFRSKINHILLSRDLPIQAHLSRHGSPTAAVFYDKPINGHFSPLKGRRFPA